MNFGSFFNFGGLTSLVQQHELATMANSATAITDRVRDIVFCVFTVLLGDRKFQFTSLARYTLASMGQRLFR